MGVQRTHHWKKIILWRNYFFHWLLFPSNKIDSFGIIHPWGKQKWCYKQKYKFRKLFLRKLCFSLNHFEWHSYKWGVRKTDDRKGSFCLGELFSQKAFHIKIFQWFGMNYQKGTHKRWWKQKICLYIKLFLKINFFRENVLDNIVLSGRTKCQS